MFSANRGHSTSVHLHNAGVSYGGNPVGGSTSKAADMSESANKIMLWKYYDNGKHHQIAIIMVAMLLDTSIIYISQ